MVRRGFSLIEMSLALLVLAIVAAAVTLHWNGAVRRSRIGDVISQIEQFDRRTRHLARQQGRPLQAVVDVGGGRMTRFGRDSDEQIASAVTLPDHFVFGQLRHADRHSHAGPSGIGYSSQGYCRTYAIRIDGPDGRSLWLLFAGLSGQMIEARDEPEVENIMSQLR